MAANLPNSARNDKRNILSAQDTLQIFQDALRMLAQAGTPVKYAVKDGGLLIKIEGVHLCQHCHLFKYLEQMSAQDPAQCTACKPDPTI